MKKVLIILVFVIFQLFSQNLQQGLIAYYPFNGNANDESGNNRHGVVQGNPALVQDRFGNSNGAYSFDGNDDRIKLPSFSVGDTLVDKTICAWFKVMNDSVYTYLFTMQTDTTDFGSPKYFLIESNRNSIKVTEVIYPFFNNPSIVWKTISPGQYHFIAIVSSNLFIGNKTKIYLDGIHIGSLNQKVIRDQPMKHIGWSMQWGGLAYGYGAIDELRIYNRALSESEIYALYTIPVELNEINISSVSNTVNIAWRTATETNNKGFSIFRDENFVSFISGNGTSTEEKSYSFSEANVPSGKHYYKVMQHDYDGTSKEIANLEVFVGGIADSYELLQNFPNPFNPTTSFEYQIPVNSNVRIAVYNSLGEVVQTLINEEKDAGFYSATWNGRNEYGQSVSSGIYYYQIQAGDFVQSRKMILMK